MVPADQDYKILIDIEARDASLWFDSENDGKVQASHGGLDVVAISETSPTFPIC